MNRCWIFDSTKRRLQRRPVEIWLTFTTPLPNAFGKHRLLKVTRHNRRRQADLHAVRNRERFIEVFHRDNRHYGPKTSREQSASSA